MTSVLERDSHLGTEAKTGVAQLQPMTSCTNQKLEHPEPPQDLKNVTETSREEVQATQGQGPRA